jgi:hypothetical protein
MGQGEWERRKGNLELLRDDDVRVSPVGFIARDVVQADQSVLARPCGSKTKTNVTLRQPAKEQAKAKGAETSET